MNEYDYGATVKMACDFKVDGTLTDPTSITLTVTDPSGDATSYTYAAGTVTQSATGEFYKELACSEAGEWAYTWTGTGTCAAVGTKRFSIRRQGA